MITHLQAMPVYIDAFCRSLSASVRATLMSVNEYLHLAGPSTAKCEVLEL